MPLKTYADPRRLIDTTDFDLNGETLTASRYGTPNRQKGRRIVVRDAKGIVRFDTDDHYDNANAVNAFDLWLATRSKPQEYRVHTSAGPMLIGAKTQAEAEQIAVDDGHRLAPAESKEALIEKIMAVVEETIDYTPEPYPVDVKLVDEGGQDRDVCDDTSKPTMTEIIRGKLPNLEECPF